MNNKDAVCAFGLSSNFVLVGVEVDGSIGRLNFCFLGGGWGCCGDSGGDGVLNTEGFVFKSVCGGEDGGGGGTTGACVCAELSPVKLK